MIDCKIVRTVFQLVYYVERKSAKNNKLYWRIADLFIPQWPGASGYSSQNREVYFLVIFLFLKILAIRFNNKVQETKIFLFFSKNTISKI